MRKSLVGIALASVVCVWVHAGERREEIDLGVAHRIRAEAFGKNSKVMDIAFNLTDVRGPRLTGSPQIRKAAEWASGQMKEWGLAKVELEPWGPFGRGWSCSRFVAQMQAPQFAPLIGFALPWSPGTGGEIHVEAVLAPIATAEDFEKYRGKLKGKAVLLGEPRPVALPLDPLAVRLSDAELRAETLQDLAALPGNHLEALKGDRKGQHSIRINHQYRLCFVWADGDAADVEIVDYH